ncbi:RISC-loading complex subunit TARBP2-like [Tribolium madens]|uniref:RISC-loading complex subunit TARBP2-like n=1 Tax=Tribolium madens TaxID=41895 RepID=UPI001CF7213B|nr:RISC-loading complex subunit TARBP2-like [Tribolium madens]XP_044265427.1 RISC-loading complex subunit TARBP2-like [Tribolium madens]XP_044265428.1 RISC-loading complex subunit TARBP2-like [Tribolium madens]
MSQQNTKTPAMVLQEFTVKRGFSPPEYILVMSKTGTHENEFHYKVNVANVRGMGFGRSKQVAKHNAASKALEILAEQGLYDPSSNPAQEFNAQSHRNESDSPLKPPVNFIGNLKDMCCELKLPYPEFKEISDVGPPHCREFTYECSIASITTQATANTKKQAKQLAARDMLEKIRETCPELTEQFTAESNSITSDSHEVLKKYSELSTTLDVIPNRAVMIGEFSTAIKKRMIEKNVSFEDFQEQFKLKNKVGIDYIFEKLDIKYNIELFQETPPILCALFGLDTPFTVMAVGRSEEDSMTKLIHEIYVILDIYMNRG